MRIIGLGHYSRVGKDSLANYLVQSGYDLGFRIAKKSFASKLKAIAHDLYGWAGLQNEAYYNDPEHEHERDVVLPALGMTPVDIWVKLGTALRGIYAATWIDYLLKTNHGLDILVIPDVRFPNEVEAIREQDGYLVKVVRDGYGPRDTVADLALNDYTGWDAIVGRGGLPELKKYALDVMQRFVDEGFRDWDYSSF